MKLLRLLIWPLSFLYGIAMLIRNLLFNFSVLSKTEFKEVTLIGVGNLSAGGTGKTPHIEYLINLLHPHYKVATLSRGYGRKTTGFQQASTTSTALEIGDEPKQFRNRFPIEIPVAVDANRVNGVKQLIQNFPFLEVVLLDDVFQHRSIKPGLQILLTDYAALFYKDYMLPTGYLREPKSGMKRADIIVVSKTPDFFSPLERKRIIQEIKLKAHQKIYFSKIVYGNLMPIENKLDKEVLSLSTFTETNYSVVLLTGIANSKPLEYFLKDKVAALLPMRFSDHHEFKTAEILELKEVYKTINKTGALDPASLFKHPEVRPGVSTRSGSNPDRLLIPNSKLEIRRNFFTVRVMEKSNALPQDLKSMKNLQQFKHGLNTLLG